MNSIEQLAEAILNQIEIPAQDDPQTDAAEIEAQALAQVPDMATSHKLTAPEIRQLTRTILAKVGTMTPLETPAPATLTIVGRNEGDTDAFPLLFPDLLPDFDGDGNEIEIEVRSFEEVVSWAMAKFEHWSAFGFQGKTSTLLLSGSWDEIETDDRVKFADLIVQIDAI